MRLIDADALKTALKDAHINMELTFDIATFNCVMSTIDNAPTCKPCENCDLYFKATGKGGYKE